MKEEGSWVWIHEGAKMTIITQLGHTCKMKEEGSWVWIYEGTKMPIITQPGPKLQLSTNALAKG